MTTDCSITNIGLSTGSGWRLIRKIPVWTGSSKAGTRGDIIRAASSPAAFSTMFSLSRELGFILQGFLLSLLFNVLILFITDLFPSSPRGDWVEKWLFLVIEAPLLRSSLHLHLILSAQVRFILALQSKTSVLGASAGQTSAFLPELLVLPMLGERARARTPHPPPRALWKPLPEKRMWSGREKPSHSLAQSASLWPEQVTTGGRWKTPNCLPCCSSFPHLPQT